MRPVLLMIQAYGPYIGREVVDFRSAVAAGLFGIYGPTGSGKSSIFSAVTFALFGEAAKADQETTSLRCDHADPNVPTEVGYVFDVGERRYFIRRSTEQMRPKQRGGGETRSPHEAAFFDATGLSVEEIVAGKFGKVLAEKKTSVVRDAVIRILGYGPEQFRQIVLLPQGKFETFLAAKTDARLAILRELFDVSIYRKLAAKFKEDAAAAERQVKQEREVCNRRLVTEGFADTEALSAGITQAQTDQQQAATAESEAFETVNGARALLEAARKLDGLFEGAKKAASDLLELETKEAEIRALEEQVKNARRAQALADVERHASDADREVETFAGKLQTAQILSEGKTEQAGVAAQALIDEKAKAYEIERLRLNNDALARHRTTLAGASNWGEAAKEELRLLGIAQSGFDTADRRHCELVEQKTLQEQGLKLARDKTTACASLNVLLSTVRSTLKEAERFEKVEKALETSIATAARLEAIHQTKALLVVEARGLFETAESNLAAAQALHLAAKLTPGDACPVCGSHDHPAPATGAIENAGLDAAFRGTKTAWEDAQAKRESAAHASAEAAGALNAVQADFAELPKPAQSAASLCEQVAGITDKISELGPAIDLASVERLLDETLASVGTALIDRETKRDELGSARQKEALARDRYEQALSAVPEEFRESSALVAAHEATQIALQERLDTLEAAETAARDAREEAIGASKDFEAAADAHAQAIGRRDQAQGEFLTRLATSGLTEEIYQSFKLSIPTIDADAEAVEDFGRLLGIARQNDVNARAEIVDRERPDLIPIEANLLTCESVYKLATGKRAEAGARLTQLEKLQNSISDTLLSLQKIESETGALRHVAALFNAENDMRLDLETYAIGAMFDYVLLAANLRLDPMTNGRYRLEREGDEGGGRSRRGLGIRVFDVHTGKPRPPSTLSGGETFIAALALALGLSDVVESVNGKVQLDTIFIDEGFGSLDTENDSGTLDQVLQVLTNLVSQRRAVGLISHVPLVQEAIPNGFYVRKELRGSHIETRDM